MRLAGFLAVLVTGALLIYAVDDLPDWGSADSPANSGDVSVHYLVHGGEETGVPNIVTAVLADYRSYDTMFETVVIFTAGIAILAMLRGLPPLSRSDRPAEDPIDPIVQTSCRLLTPVIQIFALYVLAHGHHSPGGGFQGGVILGASFILTALARDLRAGLRRLPERAFLILAAAGIVLYAGIGVVSMVLGAPFLDYAALDRLLPGDAVKARYHSILGVEIGVALTVSAVMFAIYAYLSSRGALEKGL